MPLTHSVVKGRHLLSLTGCQLENEQNGLTVAPTLQKLILDCSCILCAGWDERQLLVLLLSASEC